jgi:hypothetical protein
MVPRVGEGRMELTIRRGRAGDEDAILGLLYELAQYEKLTDKFRLTREIVTSDFLGPAPSCCSALAFLGEEAVGVITWFPTYASFSAVRTDPSRGSLSAAVAARQRPWQKDASRGSRSMRSRRELPASAGSCSTGTSLPSHFTTACAPSRCEGWLSYRLTGDALEDLADQA